MARDNRKKQKITINVSSETARQAKLLAARGSTCVSSILSEQVEKLFAAEEDYNRAERAALALLGTGFHLGGAITGDRDDLHYR